MRKWLAMLRPSPTVLRRLLMVGVLAGVGVGAFCWGHYGAVSSADGQQINVPVTPASDKHVTSTPGATTDDYSRRVVGYVYDNIPVMREELGEYLIARFGKERLEFLMNRKIVEMACKSQGIVITDAQVEAQLIEDIKSFPNITTREQFTNQVLKRFNKTLYEWKEDVIRPKLAMSALVKPLVKVTPLDVEREFESRYGPKVQCRLIVLRDGDKHVNEKIWQEAAASEAGFREQAHKQFIPELAAHDGEAPPIFRHCPEKALEDAAFQLKPGETSGLIQASDKTWFILRCEKHIPADQSVRLDQVRMKLTQEVYDKMLAAEIPKFFQRLREQAHPRNMLDEHAHYTAPNLSPVKMIAPPVSH
jgi:hypothetical protein